MSLFKCPYCQYQSDSQPGKWSIMHGHLVRNHPDSITPLFRCIMCKAGFQDNRAYRKHKQKCEQDPQVNCELCGTNISSSRLVTHAMWHIKIAQEQDELRRKNPAGNDQSVISC